MTANALLLTKVRLNTFVYICMFWYRFVLHFIPIMNMNVTMNMKVTLSMTMRVSLKRFRKRVVGKNL